MAEDQATTAPEETQTTTAPEATTEAKTDLPAAPSETAEAPTTTTTSNDAEKPEADKAAAETEATTEAATADGTTGETEPAAEDAAAGAVTPASAKGKRKSTGGVPEHKNKKGGNKRKSMVNVITEAKPGDYFLAKFKGFPPWPSIICDESMLPETLLATRPVSTINAQGELRADYQEGGKNAKDRTYPVMFLETNEFAWIVNTALTPLNPGDTSEDKLKPKMSAALKNAYALAEERHDIEYYKKILQEHQEAEKERQEELAAKDAEKQEKAAKKQERAEKAAEKEKNKEKAAKRKSTAKSKDTVTDEDEMEVDGKSKPSKKRKKGDDSDGEGPKPKKTPKTIKLKAEKTPNGASAKKADKKKKVVSKPAEETEEKEVLTDAQKLERREKGVLYLRHRLQKGFLARDQTPKEEEMDAMAEFFTQLEGYGDLEPVVLRNTKINKVLKGIVKLSSIPKEEEYNFKKRSNDLLASWNNALDQNKGETPTTSAPPTESAPAENEAKTNGDATEKSNGTAEEAATEQAEAEKSSDEAKEESANDSPKEDVDVTMTDAPKEDKPDDATEKAAEKAEEKTEAAAPASAEAETAAA